MKSDESKSSKGLEDDPWWRANAAVRGFIHQFWRTVEAWIELDPEELLYVEGGEDFDAGVFERLIRPFHFWSQPARLGSPAPPSADNGQ